MRGKKVVQLPCKFRYSESGMFKDEFAVTVCAPSLDQFVVHNKMVAYAADAVKKATLDEAVMMSSFPDSFWKVQAELRSAQTDTPVEPEPETDEQMTARVIGVFSAGLGSDKFPEFMEFLKKTLTNNAKLARIGETNLPLTDLVWSDIAANGDMDAVNLIFASFASFFLKEAGGRSAEKTGNSSQPTSPSAPVVH